MAARKKKTTRKKRTRNKGSIRRKGDDLPKMIDSARVLRALDGTMTEKRFIKAYDDAEGKRGGGLRTPSPKLTAAYNKFEGDGSFGAFSRPCPEVAVMAM